MTFDQLEYFIAVCEQDTFFDAAEVLHISQSTLSKQIKKLETELGISLLDRSKRSASLTEGGHIFYQEAQKLTKQYHQSLALLAGLKDACQSRLRIGTLPILTHYHLTGLFKKFAQLHPDIHLEIDEVEEKELMRGLELGKYDLIVAREYMLKDGAYESILLAEDELVCVLPAAHKLAAQDCLALNELAGENFILMNPYTSVFQLCMDEFEKYGITPNVIQNARVESIIGSVAVGEGISLLPKNNFEIFRQEDIQTVPLNPPVRLPVAAAVKKGSPSRAAGELMDYCSHLQVVRQQ